VTRMTTTGYVRVSTDRQADLGISLEAQEAKIRAMATVRGVELEEVIVDGGESAKDLNRPGMQRLLELVVNEKIDAVIVAKLDRLTRSVKDLSQMLELFEKRKVALISVAESLDTSSAAGRLVITIMGAVSQWEREAIGERTRDALRHKRSQGQRVGNIAFGFRLGPDGEHLEQSPIEQAALEEIRKLRSQGHSMRRIAAVLNHRACAQDRAALTDRRSGCSRGKYSHCVKGRPRPLFKCSVCESQSVHKYLTYNTLETCRLSGKNRRPKGPTACSWGADDRPCSPRLRTRNRLLSPLSYC
jgi:site-specific DNA recombinase